MMSKFKVGDHVFYSKSAPYQEIQVLCPVCYGKRQVVLILGNDDRCTMPCVYCRLGCDAPSGYVTDHTYIAVAEPVTITGIRTNESIEGQDIEYHFGSCYLSRQDRLFENEEDALEKAEAIKKEYDEERKTKAIYLKKSVKKKYSWNAGYHLRAKKKNLKDAEYHGRMAVLCKAKTKE